MWRRGRRGRKEDECNLPIRCCVRLLFFTSPSLPPPDERPRCLCMGLPTLLCFSSYLELSKLFSSKDFSLVSSGSVINICNGPLEGTFTSPGYWYSGNQPFKCRVQKLDVRAAWQKSEAFECVWGHNQPCNRLHGTILGNICCPSPAALRLFHGQSRYRGNVGIDPMCMLIEQYEGRCRNFWCWYCDKLKARKSISVESYLHTLSQLYIKWTGQRMSPQVLRHIYEVRDSKYWDWAESNMIALHGELAEDYDLDFDETDKPLLDLEDFGEILQCYWVTDTNTFPHERQRIQLATMLLLSSYTISRPRAFLEITYGDIELFVQQKKTGEEQVMMRLKLTKTKSRMKRKRP